jgi:hypothetical protein
MSRGRMIVKHPIKLHRSSRDLANWEEGKGHVRRKFSVKDIAYF